jgi:hypothetical protein
VELSDRRTAILASIGAAFVVTCPKSAFAAYGDGARVFAKQSNTSDTTAYEVLYFYFYFALLHFNLLYFTLLYFTLLLLYSTSNRLLPDCYCTLAMRYFTSTSPSGKVSRTSFRFPIKPKRAQEIRVSFKGK